MAKRPAPRQGRGGSRKGSGRPLAISYAKRAEIAHEYRTRMQIWAYVHVMRRDPVRKKRRAIDAKMREKAAKHNSIETVETTPLADLKIPRWEAEKLDGQLADCGEPAPVKRIEA